MVTYQVQLCCQKTRARWDPRDERATTDFEPAGVLSHQFETRSRPKCSNMMSVVTSFLFPATGVTVHHLSHFPDEPGHFRAIRLEDIRGVEMMPSQRGQARYVARYDLQISYRVVEPLKPFDDTMGLPVAIP